ncbi:MAG: hypothetical protein GAK45_02009 [Pseudomonas citronellolis]|nr:MAG: hypothetical protein GAK45_02009 [Pseudomonas citronellolis]
MNVLLLRSSRRLIQPALKLRPPREACASPCAHWPMHTRGSAGAR